MEGMNVKIGIDLSDLIKGASQASAVISDIGKTAAQSAPGFTKITSAADALEDALEQIAKKGRANINAIADAASKANAPINTLTKNVAAFGGGVVKSQVPDYFKKISDEAAKAGNALSSKVKPGTDRAGAALLDLSRIAQDAPFGFIGIQNNINPLLESFGRLRAETGSTGGALKALASGAMGAGGLGLAVSVATGLLTVLAQQGFFKVEEKADEAKKKLEDFNNAVKSIYSDAGKEAAQVTGMVAVLESETATREKKLATIKELQRISPEIFAGLKLEGNAVAGVDAAYQNYIKNLQTVIATKIIQKQLEDSITQSLQFQGAASTKSISDAAGFIKGFNDAKKAKEGYVKTAGDLKYDKELSAENKRLVEQKELLDKLKELQSGIKVSGFKIDDPSKQKAHVKDLDDVIRELNEDLALNSKYANIGFISSSEQDIKKIERVKSAIEEILKLKKGPGVNSVVVQDLITSIKPEEVRKQLGERSAEIVKTLKTVSNKDLYAASDPIKINLPVELKPSVNTDRAISEIDQKLREDFNKLTSDIQKTVINSGLSSIGDMIGSAIAGGSNVGQAFVGLLNVVISGMKQLGEAMIGLGTAKSVLEKFNLAPGVGTIAAGIGVIALSSLIQSALPKFADGVQGYAGGVAIVGERGPEIVRLPQSSSVIPNHRLGEISGGGQQVFIPNISLRGSDLLIAFNRAQSQQNRRG
jgi:hypothetical protein